MIILTGSRGYIGKSILHHTRNLPIECLTYNRSTGMYSPLPHIPSEKWGLLGNTLIHAGATTPKKFVEQDQSSIESSNIESTETLMNLVCKLVKRVIFLSTADVYGQVNSETPITESSQTSPKSGYAKSKVACEEVVRDFAAKFSFEAVILRIGSVYGPNDDSYSKFIPEAIRASASHSIFNVYSFRPLLRPLIFEDDLVKQIHYIVKADSCPPILNLVGEYDIDLHEVLTVIQSFFGELQIVYKDFWPEHNYSFNQRVFDRSLAKKYFGNWDYTSIGEGIESILRARL